MVTALDYAPGVKSGDDACIYCSAEFDRSVGDGDHVVPRAFGDFEGAILFRGLCQKCNNDLSVLEEELLRTAPEAVFRRYAGATTNRRGEPVGWQGASGLPPPRFVIPHSDHSELVNADPSKAFESRPIDQLTIVLRDERTFHILYYPTLTANALRRRLSQLGINETDIARSYWHCDEKHAPAFRALLTELWPQHQHGDLPDTPAGTHQVPVRIECKITDKYYRAITKIAFHYFLANSRCGFTGHEPCFSAVRDYLTNGGDKSKFFNVLTPDIRMPVGVLPDGTALLPARWMHQLWCFESAKSAVVAVYTLFGPLRPPSPHFVTLFQEPSKIIVPTHRYGHAYVYGDADLGDTRAAFVEPLAIGVVR